LAPAMAHLKALTLNWQRLPGMMSIWLGWDALALFGCCRHLPLAHPRSAGLLWIINGGRLVELRRDWAVVELAENGWQRIFDRRRPDAANFTLPWMEPEAT